MSYTARSGDSELRAGQRAMQAKVAVVTRTRDRPLLLRRAASSIESQTFGDYIWVVVNDGGDGALVSDVIAGCGIDPTRILVLSREQSHGMEVASNAGIRAVSSEFVTIHDDDDSWDPEFLEKTVRFLDDQRGSRYGGVVTYSTYISEDIKDNEVIEIDRRPYQNRAREINLEEILRSNLFPPISFLFRRSIYEGVGGFNESFPVLGDWFFNMEFLLKADIGVLPEQLAFYHHRDQGGEGAGRYANSVIDRLSLHEEYTSLARNEFFRRHINKSAVSLGLVVQNLESEPRGRSTERVSSPTPLGHVPTVLRNYDDSDRNWVIGAVNRALATRSLRSFVKNYKIAPLEPNAGWSSILPVLRKLKVTVPTPSDFDEKVYLEENKDVAGELARGKQRSAYTHYLFHGRGEARRRPGGQESGVPATNYHESVIQHSGNVLKPVLNGPLMSRYSHPASGFDRVLHVAHHEWHGIRQATAYGPGQKLLIPANSPLEQADKNQIAHEIQALGIKKIVFQGFSDNADQLLLHLKSHFGSSLECYAVTHVNTAQFEHYFEMVIQARLLTRLRLGTLQGLASVKPNFSATFEGYWPGLILNFAPKLAMPKDRRSPKVEVLAPLDPGWRKNLFTNILGASVARNVDIVKTANFPNGLENICDLHKLRLVGYLRGKDLLDEMARSSLVLLATLAECQPMTQLESFAVGTPAITGPLGLEDFSDDPLIGLCTTRDLDNPAHLAKDIERVIDTLRVDPAAMEQMISSHLTRRHALAVQRYADFLGL